MSIVNLSMQQFLVYPVDLTTYWYYFSCMTYYRIHTIFGTKNFFLYIPLMSAKLGNVFTFKGNFCKCTKRRKRNVFVDIFEGSHLKNALRN